jgi:acylglycerol lipase
MKHARLAAIDSPLRDRALEECACPHGFVASRDGTQLYYRFQMPTARSPRDDRIVLVLHGISWHSAPYFAVFVHYLVPLGITVYAMDFRGHGFSGGLRGDLDSPAVVMDDIDSVVQFLCTQYPARRIFLAGQSMGGLFALAYVAQRQPQLAGLVLTAPGLLLHPRQVLRLQTVGEALRAALRPRRGVIDMVGWRLRLLSRWPGIVAMRRADKLALDRISLEYSLTLVRVNALWQFRYPSRVRVPTLIIQGLADRAVLPSGATTLFKRVAAVDKTLVTFTQMNHSLLWDVDTPLVFEKITHWLKEH